jgi:hypothetical protein
MSNSPMMIKNSAKGFVYNGDTKVITQITDVDYPSNVVDGSQLSVVSITRTGSVATVTFATAHGYTNGRVVTISAANQAEYNGSFIITYIDTLTFSYTVTGAPVTPATGTIKSQLLQQTVPGIVVIDGTYYVMTPKAEIYGSALEDPLTWTALNFITAEVEFDGGVAIAKYLNLLMAFGTWSTEIFADMSNAAPGSPLGRQDNVYLPVGCADARTIATGASTVVWLAQAKEGSAGASAGRKMMTMEGFAHKLISTPPIERTINHSNLSVIYSFLITIAGHQLYGLTLVDTAITLVYDFNTTHWYQWTSTALGNAQTVTTLTMSSDGISALVYLPAHGYADGDPVLISGATQTDYNGTHNITYIDVDNFSYALATTPVSPATGTVLATGSVESYFSLLYHAAAGNANLFIDKANGYVYQLSDAAYDDAGAYINFVSRTPNVDMSSTEYKRITRLDLIGDKVTGSALVRYSKDDYQTHSNYRVVPLGTVRSHISRVGRARRASFDVRVTDSIPVRFERMDVFMEGGE